jgi:hypothetical protein
VVHIDIDLHEDIECVLYEQVLHRDEATVAVVHNKVALERLRGQVVNTAGAVGHISEDKGVDSCKFS